MGSDRGGKVLATLEPSDLSRRQYLALASSMALPAAAGCSGQDAQPTESTSPADGDGGSTPTGTQSSASEPKQGGTLVTSLESPIRHLDPHYIGQLEAHIVGNRIQEPLVKLNRNLEIEGLLATDVEVSDDGLLYTLPLREGVMFQEPFKREMTADDVIFNFDRIAGPDSESLWKLNFAGVSDYRKVDEYTVEIEMAEVHSSFREWLGNMGINILSPEAIDEYGDARTHPVGTGPFKFEEWETRDHITLSRHDDYWKEDQPYLDEVVFRPIAEPQVKVTELQSGNVHILRDTPPSFVNQVLNDDSLQFKTQKGGGWAALYINTSSQEAPNRAADTPTANRKIRQAIQEGIDRREILNAGVGGFGRVTQTWWPPESPWGVELERYSMESNPEKAKQLIEEAGFSTPVELNIVSHSDMAEQRRIGRVTQANLRQAGFDAKLHEFSVGKASAALYSHQYDVYVNAVGYLISPDIVYAFLNPNMIYQQPYDQNPNNSHEEVYSLFEEADSVMDLEQRKELYREVQEVLLEDSPHAILYHPDHRRSFRNTVKDYNPHPFLLNYDLDHVWLDE